MTTILTLQDLPVPVRLHILLKGVRSTAATNDNRDEDHDNADDPTTTSGIEEAIVVSKQWYTELHDAKNYRNHEHLLLPVLEITPAINTTSTTEATTKNPFRTIRLLQQLRTHLVKKNEEDNDDTTTATNRLQRYTKIRVRDPVQFQGYVSTLDRQTMPSMEWVSSLEMTSTTTTVSPRCQQPRPYQYEWSIELLPITFASMFPNLRELNFSKSRFSTRVLPHFTHQCPRLERITWNHLQQRVYAIAAEGTDFCHHAATAATAHPTTTTTNNSTNNNLKELILDNGLFHFKKEMGVNDNDDENTLRVNHNHRGGAGPQPDDTASSFLFHVLCSSSKKLERVSIRNAMLSWKQGPIPQQELLNFVRCCPATMTWFRSDLSPHNIQRVQHERPDLELVN